jgi:hypothetical protein
MTSMSVCRFLCPRCVLTSCPHPLTPILFFVSASCLGDFVSMTGPHISRDIQPLQGIGDVSLSRNLGAVPSIIISIPFGDEMGKLGPRSCCKRLNILLCSSVVE